MRGEETALWRLTPSRYHSSEQPTWGLNLGGLETLPLVVLLGDLQFEFPEKILFEAVLGF